MPNALLDALISWNGPGKAKDLWLQIYRETYGWNREWATLCNSELVRTLQVSARHIYNLRDMLRDHRLVLYREGAGKRPAAYSIQRNASLWLPYDTLNSEVQSMRDARPAAGGGAVQTTVQEDPPNSAPNSAEQSADIQRQERQLQHKDNGLLASRLGARSADVDAYFEAINDLWDAWGLHSEERDPRNSRHYPGFVTCVQTHGTEKAHGLAEWLRAVGGQRATLSIDDGTTDNAHSEADIIRRAKDRTFAELSFGRWSKDAEHQSRVRRHIDEMINKQESLPHSDMERDLTDPAPFASAVQASEVSSAPSLPSGPPIVPSDLPAVTRPTPILLSANEEIAGLQQRIQSRSRAGSEATGT